MPSPYEMYPEEEIPQQGIVLQRALARRKSAGGTLTNNVDAPASVLPNAVDSYRSQANNLSDRAFKMMDTPLDYSGLQNFAKQRGQQGDSAMLNAMAAQFAGEGFAPLQEQLLKKASTSRDPIKMAGGMITSEGGFVKDPEASQDKQVNMLLQRSAQLAQIAETADTARERIAAQRAQQDVMAELRKMGLNLQQQSIDNRASTAAATLSLQQQSNDIRANAAAATRALAEQNAFDRKDRLLGDSTQKLSKQTEDQTGLYAGVDQLNQRLSDYASKNAKIPGIGVGSKLSVLGMDVSGPFIGEEGKTNRALAQNVLNQIMRADSGQAVTTQEMARQLLSAMNRSDFTEKDFMNAWENNILPRVNASFANIGGGYSTEVKDRYRSQGGKINFDKPFANPRKTDSSSGFSDAEKERRYQKFKQENGG
jgi:hypothetical protein